MNNIVASETTLKREAYAIAKQAFDLIQSKAIAFVKELLSDDLAPNGRLRRFTSARQKQSTETPFADLAGLTSLTPDTLNNNVALSNTPSVAPISATAAFVAPSLSRSLSNKFTVAQSPTFVNRDVAKAILTHRDVALRDANDMAANNFIGPQTPAVATQIRALNSWNPFTKISFETFRDNLLEKRGLILTTGPHDDFGVAVHTEVLTKLNNTFSRSNGGTPYAVWTYTPTDNVTTARELDAPKPPAPAPKGPQPIPVKF